MDLESIYALMERFERSTLTGLELEQNGTRLKLDRTVTAAPAAAAPSPAAVPVPSAAPAAQPPQESGAEYIKAPLVGTFYAASGPDSAPFVKAGDQVRKGQTVCILEAMKMMSWGWTQWRCTPPPTQTPSMSSWPPRPSASVRPRPQTAI